ncbi:uncharacterized protein BT62DRAFT_1072508 [Guyanagaster necrorhizus]|uniref:Pre-rRNA-processing protein n=1 Tax=Guyanagaster necrorhizus TaxID=856835 RepID=A0A9P7W1U4_9AGAR|nr:uncharacterized protein BT62DRAFT_1072508 [Guyanagaster necrorhizus MCA 3950]KAG7450434.1 hypothetical protein BT62DRAFT_1072508 [Guyanagaster necrorhizus MCA 3950]
MFVEWSSARFLGIMSVIVQVTAVWKSQKLDIRIRRTPHRMGDENLMASLSAVVERIKSERIIRKLGPTRRGNFIFHHCYPPPSPVLSVPAAFFWKSAKRRKDKAADFTKAKLKLGKGKQVASNAIDTSFKARSIALPSQSITKDRDDDTPTTRRRLTLDELVAHTKHYGAATRKDALAGFRELFETHSHIINESLTALFNTCVRLIGDEDAGEQLIPHAPTLLLFTSSAQTHIFPEIRIDAIKILDLLLIYIPEPVISGWNQGGDKHGSRVLEGYLGLLNAGTKFGENDGPVRATSTASVVLTATSKLVVLRSFATFLRQALSLTSHINPRWYLASSFDSPASYGAFDQLFRLSSCQDQVFDCREWRDECDDGDEDFVLNEPRPSSMLSMGGHQYLPDVLNMSEDFSGSHAPGNITFISNLARALQSTLVSTFLDYAPAVFSPSSNPQEVELDLILAVSDSVRSIYGEISHIPDAKNSSLLENLTSILGYMTPFFPFRPGGKRDIKIEQAFQDLNLVYCELSSLLVLTSRDAGSPLRSRQQRPSKTNSTKLSMQNDIVCDYVLRELSGSNVSSSQVARSLTSAAYTSLTPTMWSLINCPSQSSSAVFGAILEHGTVVSAKSALKKPTVDFISRLILMNTDRHYRGHFKIGQISQHAKLVDWIEALPKTLWELGNTDLALSETILRFLLRLLQRQPEVLHEKMSRSLRSRFVPYFVVEHPVRGQIPGPFTKLPHGSTTRRLALDVVATMQSASFTKDKLCLSVSIAVKDTMEGPYWTLVNL